jgi:hypothetical protein
MKIPLSFWNNAVLIGTANENLRSNAVAYKVSQEYTK